LPLYCFQIELETPGWQLAETFEQYPSLPGAVLVEDDRFRGMISRRQFLEYLIRPHGIELFLKQPLRVVHSYTRDAVVSLPGNLPIVTAAQQALRRSPNYVGEPILVQVSGREYYLLDIHALNIAYWQIRGIETQVRYERAQAQMIQSDKMASLGRLVDGVAHEIIDPISFIWGNLSHVACYCDNLLELLQVYETLLPHPPEKVARLREELEVDFLRQDLPQTLQSIRTGTERLSKLATGLQNFCHIDAVYPKPADLHELMDGILLLLKSRLSSNIQIVRNYGHLPPVTCFAGQLNQVLMNLLSNAIDALINQIVSQQVDQEQPVPNRKMGTADPAIIITTQMRSIPSAPGESTRWVSICIADNGPGLSAEAQQRLRESFSIKKRTEKETSLAMSYQIVTARHGGRLEFHSPARNSDRGTEFEILLPL
jgi:signal transduction histidine kinase